MWVPCDRLAIWVYSAWGAGMAPVLLLYDPRMDGCVNDYIFFFVLCVYWVDPLDAVLSQIHGKNFKTCHTICPFVFNRKPDFVFCALGGYVLYTLTGACVFSKVSPYWTTGCHHFRQVMFSRPIKKIFRKTSRKGLVTNVVFFTAVLSMQMHEVISNMSSPAITK